MERSSPVFVVGVPRSGTTLLAAMLGSHPRLDSGPETFFFPSLAERSAPDLVDPQAWPLAATDFVCALRLRDVPVHELYGRTRDQVAGSLAARAPSIPAMLESLAAERAAANGKTRWVEKTPRHLADVALIRRLWPDAPIVRVVRDPRDVALSLSRVPFGSPSVLVNLCQATSLDREAAAFFARDSGSTTVRFEDLLEDPERELRRLCELIGETYNAAMLQRQSAEGLSAEHEWWKRGASEPIDPSRAGRWRTELPSDLQRFAAVHCHQLLRDYGYDGARDPAARVAIVPLGDRLATEHPDVLVSLASEDAIVVQPPPLTVRGLIRQPNLVFWGLPGQLGLKLGTQTPRRLLGMLRLVGDLAWRWVRGRPALWVRQRTGNKVRAHDRSEVLLARALRILARRVTPDEVGPALECRGRVSRRTTHDLG
jgi:hypothetical protein